MSTWLIALLGGSGAILSVFSVLATIWLGQFILWTETLVPRWAARRGFRVLHKEAVQLPFCVQPLYWVVVTDPSGRRRVGWVRFAFFSEKVTEHWVR